MSFLYQLSSKFEQIIQANNKLCLCKCVFQGLAQYSGDPRIEWHLNAFSTKDAVIDAVKNLPYKGGNTLTGAGFL